MSVYRFGVLMNTHKLLPRAWWQGYERSLSLNLQKLRYLKSYGISRAHLLGLQFLIVCTSDGYWITQSVPTLKYCNCDQAPSSLSGSHYPIARREQSRLILAALLWVINLRRVLRDGIHIRIAATSLDAP